MTGRLLVVLISLLLSACATRMDAPVNEDWRVRSQVLTNLQSWDFTGRIGVRDANDTQSSRIRWQQRGDNYVINLWGTLNIGATEITGSPEAVRLVQEGEAPLHASTPEDLIREQLGYDLPVANLNYWIKGIPAPGIPAQPEFNANNQLQTLQQSGWQIEYLGYTQYAVEALPTTIRMQKPPLRLDFVRLSWTLPAAN